MGNRCFESFFSKPTSTVSSITQMDAHLQPNPHTQNDSTFLYFPSFFEMQTDIGYAIQKGKHVDPIRTKLQSYLSQLIQYLNNQPYLEQLQQINSTLSQQSAKRMCYFCLQIQTVQLSFQVKTLNLKLLCNNGVEIKSINKQKMDPSGIFQLFTCVRTYSEQDDSIAIQIGDLSATLQLRQVCKQLAVVQVINLRKQGCLNPLGEIAVRIQCINNISQWRSKSNRMLESRKKQIQKILQVGETILQSSAKVYLVSSVSERGYSRLSYYKDEQFEFVQMQR